MKLELAQNIIPETLLKELDFPAYLETFDLEMSLIPKKILSPFSEKAGICHFRELRRLEGKIESGDLELVTLIAECRELPLLESILASYKEGKLEQYHLFQLGKYIVTDQRLQRLEKSLPLETEFYHGAVIEHLLLEATEKEFSSLRLSDEEKVLQQSQDELGLELAEALSTYENQIFEQTGIRMIYPYPKELPFSSEKLDQIRDNQLLLLVEKRGVCLLEYRLPDSIRQIMAKKEDLSQLFASKMAEKMATLNQALSPYFKVLQEAYEKRKQRVFQYILIRAKLKFGYCWPEFKKERGFKIQGGTLPSLGNKNQRVIPLDLELKRGSNLVFGANMSGKTTVLKSLYFHLMAIRMGLPVPAESVALHFPKQVELLLKSSGSLKDQLSGFGQELKFFTKEVQRGTYLLVDELLQSTDPMNGAELSKVFLRFFQEQDLIFFCSSHYAEVLQLKQVNYFRMRDLSWQTKSEALPDWKKLREKMPYQIEAVSCKEIQQDSRNNKKPMEMALLFALPEKVKKSIKTLLTISNSNFG